MRDFFSFILMWKLNVASFFLSTRVDPICHPIKCKSLSGTKKRLQHEMSSSSKKPSCVQFCFVELLLTIFDHGTPGSPMLKTRKLLHTVYICRVYLCRFGLLTVLNCLKQVRRPFLYSTVVYSTIKLLSVNATRMFYPSHLWAAGKEGFDVDV